MGHQRDELLRARAGVTTIAVDAHGVIAADSRSTIETEAGGSTKHICAKLYRKVVGTGRRAHEVIIGTAGEVGPALVYVDWYGNEGDPPRVLLDHDPDFTCLILTPRGLYEVDKYCRPDLVIEPFYAIGSGRKEALAAMHCGKSAVEAVRIAARIDPYTGGRVVSMSLNGLKPKRALKRKPR